MDEQVVTSDVDEQNVDLDEQNVTSVSEGTPDLDADIEARCSFSNMNETPVCSDVETDTDSWIIPSSDSDEEPDLANYEFVN